MRGDVRRDNYKIAGETWRGRGEVRRDNYQISGDTWRGRGDVRRDNYPGLALKNPPKKTQKNPPKKTHLKWVFLFFFGVFLNFLFFYENNTNFSLSNRFFMNK